MNNGKSFSLKTMEDGMVLIHSDSTAVSDSLFLLFGGSISKRRFSLLYVAHYHFVTVIHSFMRNLTVEGFGIVNFC
ncbi:ATP-dependent RNA helicase [Salix suchowensis]|nr:ATP-dependent RNA helicase [Salix suchowensis]